MKVSTKDKKEIEIEREVAIKSKLLENLLEDVGENENVIPLDNISSEVLNKILEWCEYHKNEKNLETKEELDKYVKELGEWDKKFIDFEKEMLIEMILGSNYMDIKALLEILCWQVSTYIKGKSPEEIKEFLGEEEENEMEVVV